MFCPKCRAEFREGLTHCSKCDVELVDELPESPVDTKKASKPEPIEVNMSAAVDPVLIRSVSNNIDAEVIMELLRRNNIPCFSCNRESGAYMTIYMGFSIYGEDIYVAKKDSQAAIDLLNDWDMNKETVDDESDEHYDNVPYYKRRRTAARVFSFLYAASMIVALLYGAIYSTLYLLHD